MYPRPDRRYKRAKLAVLHNFGRGVWIAYVECAGKVEAGATVDRENSSLIRDYNQRTSADALLFLDLAARLATALVQPILSSLPQK
jgi:hypothetical protein